MHIAIPVYSSHVVPIVVQLKLMILIFYNFAYIAWTSEVATVSCLYKIELKYLRYALTKDERDEGGTKSKKRYQRKILCNRSTLAVTPTFLRSPSESFSRSHSH